MELSIKRKQNKKLKSIPELKIIIIAMKNLLEGFKSKFEQAEERISEVKDRTMEIIKSEE